jgi:hypothetical protein
VYERWGFERASESTRLPNRDKNHAKIGRVFYAPQDTCSLRYRTHWHANFASDDITLSLNERFAKNIFVESATDHYICQLWDNEDIGTFAGSYTFIRQSHDFRDFMRIMIRIDVPIMKMPFTDNALIIQHDDWLSSKFIDESTALFKEYIKHRVPKIIPGYTNWNEKHFQIMQSFKTAFRVLLLEYINKCTLVATIN